LEIVPPLLVPVEELTKSSSSGSLLLKAISEVLWISLVEVIDLYFRDDSDEEARDRIVWDAINRHRIGEEDERSWLRELELLDLPYQRDNTF
jgi:hypothetical protein